MIELKTQRIHRKPRRIAHGQGLVSGVIALTLAILCLLGVLAFHFPQYLTTPELRKSYDVNVIRTIMLAAMAAAGVSRWSTSCSTAPGGWQRSPSPWWRLAALLGGHKVEVDPNFPDHTPYIGLDWFILICWAAR